MLDLSQKLSGQTTERLPKDVAEDQMVAWLSPPHAAFLSLVGRILGILQRQPRAPAVPGLGRRERTALAGVP